MSDPPQAPSQPQGGTHLPAGPDAVGSRPQKPLVARIARVVLAGALVVLCAGVVWWWAIGGRWFIVRTPSMGTYAPVGTLVWVRPVDIHTVHVGDVITFQTPTARYKNTAVIIPSSTYTHRVVAVYPNGTVRTKGDLDHIWDPWATDQQHLVGQVMAAWPGVGWLVGAFPVLLPGLVGWWVLTHFLASKRSRAPLRVLGTAFFFALAIYIYNPLFGAWQLGFAPVSKSAAQATYVGTGLMPAQLTARGSHPVTINTGEVGSITTNHPEPGGRFGVHLVPLVPWQTWPIIAAACLAPAVWSVITGVDDSPPGGWRRRKEEEPDPAPMGPQLRIA